MTQSGSKPKPDENAEKRQLDEALEEGLEETFPGSDPSMSPSRPPARAISTSSEAARGRGQHPLPGIA